MAGLITAGCFSLSVALLHIFIIIGGTEWYRFFGAGEELAQLAEQGSFIPAFITLIITLVFLIWSLYAFAGAGLIRRLPWLKPILMTITLIYLIRGLGLVPIFLLSPNLIDTFLIVTSIISLAIGIVHFIGIRQMVQSGRRS